MNQTLLINQKNNKYYIKSDFNHYIENIIFFDNKAQKKVLELKRGRHFKAQLKNDLYKTDYLGEAEARQFILNNEPARKVKENLKTTTNFYLSKADGYGGSEIELYININAEQIEINETEETNEELSDGYFHIYKNFNIKNLSFIYSDLKHIFLKNKDVECLSWREFERFNLKKIDDEIKSHEIKTEKFPQLTKYLNKLKELKKEGFDYIGHKYEEEETKAESVKVFKETFETKEKQQRDKNIKCLKDIIYSDKKIKELFNKFNVDIDVVNFED